MIYTVLITAREESAAEPVGPFWHYEHTEVVVPGEDREQNVLDFAGAIDARIEEGREAIKSQAAVDVPTVQEHPKRGRLRR